MQHYMRAWRAGERPPTHEPLHHQDASFTREQLAVLRLTARANGVKLTELLRSIVKAWMTNRPSSYRAEFPPNVTPGEPVKLTSLR